MAMSDMEMKSMIEAELREEEKLETSKARAEKAMKTAAEAEARGEGLSESERDLDEVR